MASSTFLQAMEAARDRIRNLGLSDLDSYEVQVRRLPYDAKGNYHRGVTVYPVPETYDVGTNEREAIGYGLGLALVSNNDNDSDYKLDQLLVWRETIRMDFIEDASMTGVGTVFTVKVENGHVIDWDAYAGNYDVSKLILRAYSLETRT